MRMRTHSALDGIKDFYFDRVSQIRMNTSQGLWTRGRVTLIGDAASWTAQSHSSIAVR